MLSIGGVFDWQQQQAYALPPSLEASGYKVTFADDFHLLDLSPDGKGDHTWYEGVWFNKHHVPISNIIAQNSAASLIWRHGQEEYDTSITTYSTRHGSSHAWRYGFFEVRMKWQPVEGAWPSLWLIPIQDATRQDLYGGTRESGEFDIFEGQGDHPHTFYGTVHDWKNGKDSANSPNYYPLSQGVDFDEYHTYGMEWVPGRVTWFFDGVPLSSVPTPAIMDKQDFYFVLSMQTGAGWKAGATTFKTPDTMAMTVKSVKVWQKH